MAQFTHTLCEEVIRTEGRCGLSPNEITQMARLALRALKDEDPWKGNYLRLLHWLDNNTTFYDANKDTDRPLLQSVSKRVWYHVTDNQTAYPFSEVFAQSSAAKEPE